MRVEDHPVAYGSFEGVIPEGEYGAGAVVLWDRGTWTPLVDPSLALKKGELKFQLHGKKLAGKWALVKIKGDDPKAWLLVKDRDEHARTASELDIVSARPESVVSGRGLAEVAAERDRLWHSRVVRPGGEVDPGGPAEGDGGARLRLSDLEGAVRGNLPRTQPLALATVVETPPSGDEWLHEIKHDGYRIVARIDEGEVQLVSRNGKDWTKEFPQVARAVGRLRAGTALLDGEVAAVLPNGHTSFQALQRRSDGATPLVYFAFDLLHLDGWDLRPVRLDERKQVLRRLLDGGPEALRFSDHVRGHGPEFFAKAKQAGVEGVVSKRADAPYREGRGGDWRKAKCRLTQEVVIGGWTLPSDGRASIGALHVGFYEQETLVYAGKVGSGFSERLLEDLLHRLEARRRETSPFASVPPEMQRGARWVEPDLVAQVEFAEWTDEGRMRQPVFLGIREDREARHVARERPGIVEGGGIDSVAAGRPWESLRQHAPPRTRTVTGDEVVDLLGVRLTHPDRVYYPDLGFTKLDLALYYVAIADSRAAVSRGPPAHPRALPGRARRRDVLSEEGRLLDAAAAAAHRRSGEGRGASHRRLGARPGRSRAGRHPRGPPLELANQRGSSSRTRSSSTSILTRRSRSHASRLRPGACGPCSARRACESFVKTTGGKGLHVCLPLEPEQGWEALEEFTRAVALRLAREEPETFTANMAKAQRKGKIYVDYLRNVRGANAVGVFSTRAHAGAPVSVPVDWNELDRLSGAADFTVAEVPLRVVGFASGQAVDPWAKYRQVKQRVPESLTRDLAG